VRRSKSGSLKSTESCVSLLFEGGEYKSSR
jgi:hypothetical protein